MKLQQTIRKDFFNEMFDKYPQAIHHFLKWIDEYKQEVDWEFFLGKTKYHLVPHAVQQGIFIEYMKQMAAIYNDCFGYFNLFDFDLKTQMEITFENMEANL